LAANPCPCGNSLNPKAQCVCTPLAKQRYMNRLSGPLLDRVDIRLQIQSINATQALIARDKPDRLTTAQARKRVEVARLTAADRLSGTGYQLNAQVPAALLRRRFAAPKQATKLLDLSLQRGQISMRGYDRCLRLAQTLSDLEGSAVVDESHIAQAVLLRGSEQFSRQAA
jgi:magnesium chelatase family protein